ncbi:acyl-CoA thioester hydrolase/BAAT C-terminal domain-containing protein [Alkalihalobacterium chitinilyticum]|uniref:Acyl-CoA thioesterase/BAAT N-terminal domain-containing protein n=1 Tax=Alkalihalobacterium chitinilyticum TaxID=2980103 RepID=A0ABT5VLN6_9BACI|nr:acyl-CoA thioester hydrolase/BAAT C-terminal domain-containing protein [Alkalihalobacterium chitinilyticum]MDE5416343.1 acyl-CoA thioesterase/BAAT N-terminal domain-containing protein [Alkalihalobacterium chitinilyticum]
MLPSLQVSPIDLYIDEEIMIKAIGCKPNTEVSIQATTYDEKEKKFCSHATYMANQEGIVDVSSQKPIEGTYSGVDRSGLFWSMKHVNSKWDDYYEKTTSDEVSINLFLLVNGDMVDAVTITRHFYKTEIRKEVIQDDEVKGTLFYPETKATYPAVIILGGSDGGLQEHAAAVLASKGYVVLALPYFGVEGVPKDLENIPLEYFEKATIWLQEHPKTNGEISLIGYSRGGELALLLGATFDYYKSIIAGAPSAYVTAGMKNGIFAPVTAWVYNQQPFPQVKFTYRFSTMVSMFKNWALKKPISYLSIWDRTLENKEGLQEARIPTEAIKVPVMFISGGDDQLWPSKRYVNIMEEELKKSNNRSGRNRYLYYEDAGHFLSFPYSYVNLPANVFMNVGSGMTMTFGGTKAANAAAAKDTWAQILEFLKENMDD